MLRCFFAEMALCGGFGRNPRWYRLHEPAAHTVRVHRAVLYTLLCRQPPHRIPRKFKKRIYLTAGRHQGVFTAAPEQEPGAHGKAGLRDKPGHIERAQPHRAGHTRQRWAFTVQFHIADRGFDGDLQGRGAEGKARYVEKHAAFRHGQYTREHTRSELLSHMSLSFF